VRAAEPSGERVGTGQAEADTEDELIRVLLEELKDCGAGAHDWITVKDTPDPGNRENVLRTQRLQCAFCDPRERVITITSPPEQPG
jgi:hypothetical protein